MSDSEIIQKARTALRVVRQYQKDWQELGINRVYKYFEDVEGDWLDDWDVIEAGGDCNDND